MNGFGQALLEDYADKLDNKGKDYLHRIRHSSQQMGELIDDLLKLSRLTRIEMYSKKVNLSQMVKTIVKEYKEIYPDRKNKFIIAEDKFVKGDPSLLRIILRNLIDNAIKFTSKKDNAEIEFGTVFKDGSKVFFIRDNGVGFNMDNSEKLFEIFNRQHTGYEGTGLGLATVKRIIHRHNGRIWAEGKINEGATFYFTIGSKLEP